ncbi:MAG: hypothetical protein K2H60_12805 [Muribaculaceae bacterium]|nr:hypothetical protein [Muribaculaceae bacterium]
MTRRAKKLFGSLLELRIIMINLYVPLVEVWESQRASISAPERSVAWTIISVETPRAFSLCAVLRIPLNKIDNYKLKDSMPQQILSFGWEWKV